MSGGFWLFSALCGLVGIAWAAVAVLKPSARPTVRVREWCSYSGTVPLFSVERRRWFGWQELKTFTYEWAAMEAARSYAEGKWTPSPGAKYTGITYVTLDDEPKGGA